MNSYLDSQEKIIKELGSNPELGLNEQDVLESRSLYGENSFSKEKPLSLFIRIKKALLEPMIFILIIAAIITISVNIFKLFNGQHAEFVESIGILIAITLSTSITIIMEGRSKKAFEALNKIKENIAIKTYRNGVITLVAQKDLVVGDIILIETGDKIPVDARLLESINLQVDESSLTGESDPVDKKSDLIIENEHTPLAERYNMIYGGTFISAGMGKAIVTQVGDSTEFGKIADELKKQDKTTTPLQEKLSKLGKAISVIGIGLATFIFLIQLIKLYLVGNINFDTISETFITSIVLIVAAVPEGLPTIVAASLAINIMKMAKENALVKNLVASETVGAVNIICSDKTGTLTENKMTVIKVFENSNFINPNDMKSDLLLRNFALNTSAHLELDKKGNMKFIGSPTEGALLVVHDNVSNETYSQIRKTSNIEHVYSFSSEQKKMTTIENADGKLIAFTKGSTEKILSFCDKVMTKDGIMDIYEQIEYIEEQVHYFESQAMRLIGFAHKELSDKYNFDIDENEIESKMIFDGFVVIKDPIRKEVYGAINSCRDAGISVKMLTGDNLVTAKAIASELGIIDENSLVLKAGIVEEMSDRELEEKIDNIKVIARSTPLVKLRIINLLKKKGNVVAVTGDGINDAPALKSSDVGIAMGITGTEVSKEASDIVLLDDSFATIVKAIHWGRGIYENFQRFLQFQLAVNLSSVIVIVTTILIGFKAPFTAVEILWINLIMDGPPALTLGLEPIRGDLMKNKPTSRNSSIVTGTMLSNIVITGLFMSFVIILQEIYNFLGASDASKSTVVFTLFVLFQLINAFNSRELGNVSILKHIGNNKTMLLVFLGTFILQFIITQFGASSFGTVPLGLNMWLKLIVTSLSIVVLGELVKFIRTRINNK
ncbi:MAG: calcium-translocating P-type ATPase, PMCA-type [Firmicutes bacterium]|nr:calcium-translocating P-type ATPase, PMCA-type [Bacillota bacterium]